jgi:hypothetical protein
VNGAAEGGTLSLAAMMQITESTFLAKIIRCAGNLAPIAMLRNLCHVRTARIRPEAAIAVEQAQI